MNTKTIGIVLIVLGAIVLIYSGISFTTPGKPVDILGIKIDTTDHHYIPPVVGAIALIGGIVLLVMKPNKA
jgi:hypothetical protein